MGDLRHRGGCVGCPGCDIETAEGGRSKGGVALGRQSRAAGRRVRPRLCPVLSGLRGNYVPVFYERLLPRCASTGCAARPLVLGDPNWTRGAHDFGRPAGDPHLADEPGAGGPRRRLDNVGGRRCGASSAAESLNGPADAALHFYDRDSDGECIAGHHNGAAASREASPKCGGFARIGTPPCRPLRGLALILRNGSVLNASVKIVLFWDAFRVLSVLVF